MFSQQNQDGDDAVRDFRNTAPGILIAMPQLTDPNFEKTVVLMLEHNDKGALGLVMNRPTQIRVEEIMQALEMEWQGDPNRMVFRGGPVMNELGWAIHQPFPFPSLEGGVELVPGIHLSTAPERLRLLGLRPPERMVFLLGAAGWGEGQLDWEIGEGVWMLGQATPELLFDTPHENMWEQAFREQGIDPNLLSIHPEYRSSD